MARTRLRPVLPLFGLLLLGLPLVSGLRAARGDDPADLEKRKEDLLFRLRVERAIDRGMLYLTDLQDADGSFRLPTNVMQGPSPESRNRFGESALVLYTLAHAGVDPDRAEVKRAVAYLRRHYRSLMKGDYWPQASSYSLSLVVLALHELYAKPPSDDLAKDRERYGRSIRRDENPCGYPAWAQAMIRDILDWLLANEADAGLFRYPGGLPGDSRVPAGGPGGRSGRRGGGPGGAGPGGGRGGPGPGRDPNDISGPEDLSNTQYVLLALWVGTRCGYDVSQSTLEKIARRLLAVQEAFGPPVRRQRDPAPPPKGPNARYANQGPPPETDHVRGFPYTPGGRPTGSMTAAGLSSLAIVKAILEERHQLDPALRKQIDTGLWDAIAWLTTNYEIDGNPPGRSPMWHYYYLYGLERALVIAAKTRLGAHDWYREGAQMLVDAQKKGGSWSPPNPLRGGPRGGPGYDTTMLDTCFAVLFLKRTALLPEHPTLGPPGPVTPTEAPKAPGTSR